MYDEEARRKPVNPVLRSLVNKASREGVTPLHVAAQMDDADLGEHFLRLGANEDAPTRAGHTPLMYAAIEGHRDFVWMLLEHKKAESETRDGAVRLGLEARDSAGRTALHWACHAGSGDVVRLLLDSGADIEARDAEGSTPLMHAISAEKEPVVRLLLERRARADSRSKTGRTALHAACTTGSHAVMDVLLRMRLNPRARMTDGRTPLHCAALRGHPHLFERLQAAGADIDARDAFGCTPLMCAVGRGDTLAVVALMNMHADTRIRDRTGRLPLDVARKGGFTHCAELVEGRKSGFTYIGQVKVLFDFKARSAKEIS